MSRLAEVWWSFRAGVGEDETDASWLEIESAPHTVCEKRDRRRSREGIGVRSGPVQPHQFGGKRAGPTTCSSKLDLDR